MYRFGIFEALDLDRRAVKPFAVERAVFASFAVNTAGGFVREDEACAPSCVEHLHQQPPERRPGERWGIFLSVNTALHMTDRIIRLSFAVLSYMFGYLLFLVCNHTLTVGFKLFHNVN